MGDSDLFAVEARPRFGAWQYVAIATPFPGVEDVGIGSPGGNKVSPSKFDYALTEADGDDGEHCRVASLKGPVYPRANLYTVFRGAVPRWVALGQAPGPFEFPM